MNSCPRSEVQCRWNPPRFLFRALLAGAFVMLAPAAAFADDQAAQDTRFEEALHEHERCHWGAAFDALSTLADEGHLPSAQMALLMARFDTRLYATRFAVVEARKQRWLTAAAVDGTRGAASVPAAMAAGPRSGRP